MITFNAREAKLASSQCNISFDFFRCNVVQLMGILPFDKIYFWKMGKYKLKCNFVTDYNIMYYVLHLQH